MKDSANRIALCVIVAACWFIIGVFVGSHQESQAWREHFQTLFAQGVGVRLGPLPTNRGIQLCARKQSHLFGIMWFYKSPPPTWSILCMNGHAYDLAGIELKDDSR